MEEQNELFTAKLPGHSRDEAEEVVIAPANLIEAGPAAMLALFFLSEIVLKLPFFGLFCLKLPFLRAAFSFEANCRACSFLGFVSRMTLAICREFILFFPTTFYLITSLLHPQLSLVRLFVVMGDG
jgi:hypothetical protein